MYIFRVVVGRGLVMSKPCKNCNKLLCKTQWIRDIIYSTNAEYFSYERYH